MSVRSVGASESYHAFDSHGAARYMAACPPLAAEVARGATLQAREVGDGNLNLVFIVSSDAGGSAVLKQALPYVRLVGESWPLTLERNAFERRAFEIYSAIVPDLAPRIFYGDDTLSLFVMEDLSRLRILRGGLIEGLPYPRLAADVARFCAETLVRTSDFYLSSAEKKRMVARFINPELCKITEDLVLTDPYYDAPSNAFEPALRPAVEALWADEPMQTSLALLRYAFMAHSEALLHGDLHTGSIMASPDETRVMDAEFAFFGPVGFDIGMFVANLFLNAISRRARALDAEEMLGAARETWTVFDERVEALLSQAPVWRLSAASRREFRLRILRNAVGYAGAEMIRRTIGLARVADLESLQEIDTRVRAKEASLAIGRQLIAMHATVDSFTQALKIGEM